MKMQVIFVGEYDLIEDLDRRKEAYGTIDPVECGKVDAMNEPFELFSLCDHVAIVSVVPEPEKPGES